MCSRAVPDRAHNDIIRALLNVEELVTTDCPYKMDRNMSVGRIPKEMVDCAVQSE